MVKKLLGMFLFQNDSVNDYCNNEMLGNVSNECTDRTLAYFLEKSSVIQLNNILWKQVYTAIRAKQLNKLRSYDGRFVLSIDGTNLRYSQKRHCEKCLVTVKDGKTYYHHGMLVASLVDKTTGTSIIAAVQPIENEAKYEKQDCELKAAKKLLANIRAKNAHMKYIITVDSLYVSAPFIKQLKSYGYDVVAAFSKENMNLHEILDTRCHNWKLELPFETKDESVKLWFENEDVSMYWDAISNSNIQVYGIRRERIDKNTGEVFICYMLTTIRPETLNVEHLSNIQREKWQQETRDFKGLKRQYNLEHIFNHKGCAAVFILASISINMVSIYLLRHNPRNKFPKLTIKSLLKLVKKIVRGDPIILLTPDFLGDL